jgi:hypothetical protein
MVSRFVCICCANITGIDPNRLTNVDIQGPSFKWALKDNVPKFFYTKSNNGSFTIENNQTNWVLTFYTFFGNNILENVFGLTPNNFYTFFTSKNITRTSLTFQTIVKEMLVCDFESVVLCTRYDRNIIMSFFITLLLYIALSTILSAIGLGSLNTLLAVAAVYVVFWLSYGMAPTCAPLLPACLIEDIINGVTRLIPTTIVWPQALIVNSSECSSHNGTQTTRPQCMRSCRESPFLFRSWESNIAWFACSIDPVSCTSLNIPYFPDLNAAVHNHSIVLLSNNTDTVNAFSFCAWITVAQILPWIWVLLIVVYALSTAISLPISLISLLMQTLTQVLAYTHTD